MRKRTAFSCRAVSLGSLGVVFGVIVEATPLYHFRIRRVRARIQSEAMWHAIRTLDTSALHHDIAAKPYHFDVIIHPYPDTEREMMFATLMWKEHPRASSIAGDRHHEHQLGQNGLNRAAHPRTNGPCSGRTPSAADDILNQLSDDTSAGPRQFEFPGEVYSCWDTTRPGGNRREHRDSGRSSNVERRPSKPSCA